jgi:hypothetical protein
MTEEEQEPGAEEPADDADAQDDDLTAQMSRTDGPPADVLRRRQSQAARDELDRARWERAIEAHIAAHRMALDHLEETHQWIADTYDFDLVGDSRQAATWQMAGRCIGIGRLICDALALGYTTEVLHLARSLHEAEGLVGIFPLEEGTDLVRKWLADEGEEWVRPGEVRQAQEAFFDRLAELMREAGTPPDVDDPLGLRRMIYGQQSQAAHHRRRWTQDAVAPLLRTMLRGPTTVWARRAVTAAATLVVVEGAVVSVGDALGQFMPPGWYVEHIVPFVQAFEALRATQPLP